MTTVLPDEKKEERVLSNTDLLLTTAAGGATAAAASYMNKKLSPRRTVPKTDIQKKRTKLAQKRAHAKVPAEQKSLHSKALAAEKARHSNPQTYKKTINKGRLARKAATARARVPKLGAFGALLGLPHTIGEMLSIDKEGGSSSSRLGKFVEHMTGFPAGASGRGQTDAEKRASLSI